MPAELGQGGVEAGARCAQTVLHESSLILWQPASMRLLVYTFFVSHPHAVDQALSAFTDSAAAGCCAACARRDLAPLALYAYPEAYSDFKQTMQVRHCCAPAVQ